MGMKLIRDAINAYENLPIPIWTISHPALSFLSANQAACSLLGYDEDEFLSMAIVDLCLGMQRIELRERMRLFDEKQLEPRTWTFCTKSGNVVVFSLQLSKVRLDGTDALLVCACTPMLDSAPIVNSQQASAIHDIAGVVATDANVSDLSNRLHRTLEGMSDAFFLLDENWNFAFLNSQAEKVLQREKNGLLGKSIWTEFPDAVGSMFQAEYERAVNEQQAARFVEYYPPLGKWFEVNADPTSAGLAVYFRDVTTHRARDAQLRLLDAAVSRQNDILLITEAEPFDGPDGPKIVYVNNAFERRTGYSREEVVGKTPRLLQGPKTQRDELDRIRVALEQWQPVRAELINYTKSGEEFWLELDIVPLADSTGWFTHWVAIERDVTERKQAELELKTSEERFRLIANAAGRAIWDLDVNTGHQWWSAGMQNNFGHALDGSGALRCDWYSYVHPEDIARVKKASAALKSGQPNFICERYRFRRADGSWAFVEDRAFALTNDAGTVVRVLGSMTDFTEQKQLEERLLQAQKMEIVGQLTGGLAHDFNNLLTILLGNAEILEEQLADRPSLQRLAKISNDAAMRGAELTSRLLSFSRKQVLTPKILDVAQLVQGMDHLLRRTLPESIAIEVIRAGGLWKIEADAAQLESTILNLAVNARDAMPKGGCLTIEIANAMLDDDYVASTRDIKAGQYVVIAVTDTGVGIAKAHLERVFEPFYTTKEVGKGSGLGLSMVFGFVKQSGGHIQVYSELGQGTTLKMYFPRADAGTTQSTVEGLRIQPKTLPGGNEKILVVEDDLAVRAYVTVQLLNLGYQIFEAMNGNEALQILRSNPGIDLLFTDIVMPGGMTGQELARVAKAEFPNLKILYTSGYTENSIIRGGKLDPGVKLLSKPYRREQLATKIRDVLDGADDVD